MKFSDTGKRTSLRSWSNWKPIPASEIYGPAVDWVATNGFVNGTRITGNVVQEAYLEPYGAHAGGSPGWTGRRTLVSSKSCPFKTVNHFALHGRKG